MKAIISHLITVIELAGVSVIFIGALFSIILFIRDKFFKTQEGTYGELRRRLGRSILLGLEFLVAGDIINTVVIELTLDTILTLGVIVLIRSFLSFSIELELQNKLPWKSEQE